MIFYVSHTAFAFQAYLDDTYGQCGTGGSGRIPSGPFVSARVPAPQKVAGLPKIKKIVCGGFHTVAIGEENSGVFGFGSNSALQYSSIRKHIILC